MQSAAGRRALSSLATKLHPPVPISPRESQQLLTLLTTSFRAHLDREHPVTVSSGTQNAQKSHTYLMELSQAARQESSYSSAHEHINSILSNPLFSRRPGRRASQSDAVDILRDPLSWFLDQIAMGTADIPKATVCLQTVKWNRDPRLGSTQPARMPATVIADWLRTSGFDTSKQFLDLLNLSKNVPRPFINILVPMLMLVERNTAPLWRWFTRSPELRMEETGLNADRIASFRMQLLKDMASCAHSSTRDEALIIFLRVFEMYQKGEHDVSLKIIQPLGSKLVSRIESDPTIISSTDIYESFISTASGWLKSWHKAVEAMLWLHHPTRPDPYVALKFIQDPRGAERHVTGLKSRRQFLVRLCLGTAHLLLAQGRSTEAQIAMNFTQIHFAEIVLSKTPSNKSSAVEHAMTTQEIQSLAMLDRLLPT